MSEDFHLKDRELLLAADSELSLLRSAKVCAHLEACRSCRARLAEFQATLAELGESHRDTLDSRLPPTSVSRAVLRARMAEVAVQESQSNSWWRFLQLAPVMQATTVICTLCLFAITAARFLFPHSALRAANESAIALNRAAIPDRDLTPGVARTVSLGEVCSMAHEEVERDVPTSVRDHVFQEYGITNARSDDYEIDYLIAPGLGGTEDIHNLWPEPYSSPTWNAHVKDALEEHLHQLVCSGKLDLHTAQQDISTDWIAAYKKYFHTNLPVDEHLVSIDRNFRLPAKLRLS